MRSLTALTFVFAVSAPAWAQEPGEDEDQLTPEQAMELLRDVQGLMGKSEELLSDSSRSRVPESGRLTERSRERQKDAIDRLHELLRKARSAGASGQFRGERRERLQGGSPKGADGGRIEPPRTAGAPSKFRSTEDRTGAWGHLPPRVREAILNGKRDIDDYPEEFRRVLREYLKRLAGGE